MALQRVAVDRSAESENATDEHRVSTLARRFAHDQRAHACLAGTCAWRWQIAISMCPQEHAKGRAVQAGAGGEGHLRMNVEPVAEMTGYFSPTWRVLPGYMPSTPSVPISKAWPGHEHMRRSERCA